MFKAVILTLYPEMFPGTLGQSLAGKALANGLWSLDVVNIRDFAEDTHKTVDDTPYGGGAGMVLKPDIVHKAVEHAKTLLPAAHILYTSPRGAVFKQSMAYTLARQKLIILCGRFEGVDQRVIDYHAMQEVSLGDFVLSGGEIAAQAMLDACIRLIPGVMGNSTSMDEESFSSPRATPLPNPPPQGGREQEGRPVGRPSLELTSSREQEASAGRNYKDSACLLEYPHYTRPLSWNGITVPEVLRSGNHEQIKQWRLEQSKQLTALRRPDLMKRYETGK